MARIECREVFKFDELSDRAKEKARGWYRDASSDDGWWGFVYDDAVRVGALLGIEIAQRPIKLVGGGTGYRQEIYFSGFSHQGSGSSFRGTWDAARVQRTNEGDKELLRLAETLEALAQENPELTASIEAARDYYIRVTVERGETREGLIDSLGYQTPEELGEIAADNKREEVLKEALEDFNHWIYRNLEQEWDWRNADEQVDENIRANGYEFTADGSII